LHLENKFEEIFAHFEVPSLGARFLGKLEIKYLCSAQLLMPKVGG
jgi:hypothetical protein